MGSVVIAIIVLLGLFGLPVFALIRSQRLASRLLRLEKLVSRLKAELAAADAPAPSAAEAQSAAPPEHSAAQARSAHVDKTLKSEDARVQVPPSSPPSSPPASPPPSAPPLSLEEKVGSRWTIWIGGVALALGGLFLVRYSIEYGLLGPKMRLVLAGSLALALTGLGEFLRRRDVKLEFAGDHGAHIPAILTAAGVLTGFGAVYAAFALYHFLTPLIAFVLLAAVSLAGLALSAVHGPGLAALGLAGSYATPVLAGGNTKNIWALLIYLLFVTAATYGAARLRGWLWLAIAATIGAMGWAVLLLLDWSAGNAAPLALYIPVLSALALFFLAARSNSEIAPEDIKSGHDVPGLAGLAAISLLAAGLLRYDGYSTSALAVFSLILAMHLLSAWRWPGLRMLAPWSAFITILAALTWHIPLLIQGAGPFDLDMGLVPVAPPGLARFLLICGGLAALYGLAGFAGSLRRGRQMIWSGIAVLTPLLLLIVAYWRATDFAHSVSFALAAAGLAALLAAAAEYLHRMRSKPDQAEWSEGVYLAGAFAALALALTMMLDKGWLTVAIALLTPALAWIEGRRKVPILRPIAAVLAAIVAARLIWQPLITDAPGMTPIFNWLLYAYGIPALAFALTGHLFGQRRDDRIVQIFEAAAIIFTAALAALQVRHLLNDGNVTSSYIDLAELSTHTLVWLGLTLGLRRLDLWRKRPVAHYAAIIFGLAGTASILFGHLAWLNPLISGDSVGAHPVFNMLLAAYLLPGLVCGVIYGIDPTHPRPLHIQALGAAALLLIFAWLSLQVRSLFAGGGDLGSGWISDSEWYVYSALWLAYGAVLLGAGVVLGSAVLRYGALAVIVLTIGKVFLFDMSNLSGIFRALSFIGLGAVLIGIGYLYQKVIFPPGQDPLPEENASADQG